MSVHQIFEEWRTLKALRAEVLATMEGHGDYRLTATLQRFGGGLDIMFNGQETLAAIDRRELQLIGELNQRRGDIEVMLRQLDAAMKDGK